MCVPNLIKMPETEILNINFDNQYQVVNDKRPEKIKKNSKSEMRRSKLSLDSERKYSEGGVGSLPPPPPPLSSILPNDKSLYTDNENNDVENKKTKEAEQNKQQYVDDIFEMVN